MSDSGETSKDFDWIDNLRKKELEIECEKRGLKTKGTMTTLRKRLLEHLEKQKRNVVKFLRGGSLVPRTQQEIPVTQEQININSTANTQPTMSVSSSISSTHTTDILLPSIPTTMNFSTEPAIQSSFSTSNTYFPQVSNMGFHPAYISPSQNFIPTTTELYMPLHQNKTFNHTYSMPVTTQVLSNYQNMISTSSVPTQFIPTYPNTSSASAPLQFPNNKLQFPTQSDADVMDRVRKWNIRFDQGQDPLNFLERMEELAECYQIPMNKLLKCLSEMFIKNALIWHRNNKHKWTTWNEFVKDFKTFFLPPRFRIKLADDIRARVQRFGERAKDFITTIQSMQRWQHGVSEMDKLERIYENLLPEYRLYIKPNEFCNLSELLKLAEEYEHVRMSQRYAKVTNESDKRKY